MEQRKSEKQLYLFDSFLGMPEITHPLDGVWKKGDLASPVESVRELLKGSQRVNIVPGYFNETLPQHPNLRFSFCHVDCDLYTSVKECISYILPRLSVGGVIVFDDYGFRDTQGRKQRSKSALARHVNSPFPYLPARRSTSASRMMVLRQTPKG